jgi:leucyl-tRNA synthetase
VMLVGIGQNMKVKDAKPIVKKYMIDNNEAAIYYEPENEVVSRSGDDCVVALCD